MTDRTQPLPPPPGTHWVVRKLGTEQFILGAWPEGIEPNGHGYYWPPDTRTKQQIADGVPLRPVFACGETYFDKITQIRRASKQVLRDFRRAEMQAVIDAAVFAAVKR